MKTLYPQNILAQLSKERQEQAQIICDAINRFITQEGEDPDDYADLVGFSEEELFESYLTSNRTDARTFPFFEIDSDGYFIEGIDFIHAFCLSGGQLRSFAHGETAPVDIIDIVGRAIYHGIQTIATWFSGRSAFEARIKAMELLAAILPDSISSLTQNMYQFGGVCSPRHDLVWLGHDSLSYAAGRGLIKSREYGGELSQDDRHQLVSLADHDDTLFASALSKLERRIALKGDDQGVRQDHKQHVIALSIYNPSFLMINQGMPAATIADLVSRRATIALRNTVSAEKLPGVVAQVLYNALSIEPDYLRQIFHNQEIWVPLYDTHAIFAKGPVMAFAGHNHLELGASLGFFAGLYGQVVKQQLAERVYVDPQMLKTLINSGFGHIQALDDVFKNHPLTLAIAINATSEITQYPGAWGHYDPESVINLFEVLLQKEERTMAGSRHAGGFQCAMAAHPELKRHVINSLASQTDISLDDLRYTGLSISELAGHKERLRSSDLESIFQTELGL
jgi:hypothetical protein